MLVFRFPLVGKYFPVNSANIDLQQAKKSPL